MYTAERNGKYTDGSNNVYDIIIIFDLNTMIIMTLYLKKMYTDKNKCYY